MLYHTTKLKMLDEDEQKFKTQGQENTLAGANSYAAIDTTTHDIIHFDLSLTNIIDTKARLSLQQIYQKIKQPPITEIIKHIVATIH
ncbi:MAG: hypothetical protein IGNPGNKH_00540 [Sodalis sp. Ffu]|nr:MAG: hypothetical protein IGNPGNKH_00540 [Sodalis sp. Ffu]